MFGIVFATLYVSANIAVPIAPAMTMSRKNPVRRDTTVPAAIDVVDRTTLVLTRPPLVWSAGRALRYRPAARAACAAGRDGTRSR
jgi:hypothetical protein